LDVSWLNARAKDPVGLKMEKELWSKARALVDELQRKEGRLEDGQGEAKHETIAEDTLSHG
jgi:hypothetical protein